MTDLELKIVVALRDTKKGKEFLKNWKWKEGDMAVYFNEPFFVNRIICGELKLVSFGRFLDPGWVKISECFLYLDESQMLDAIKKEDYWNFNFEYLPDKFCYLHLKKLDGTEKGFIKGKNRLEAIQQAFLEIVLGVKID